MTTPLPPLELFPPPPPVFTVPAVPPVAEIPPPPLPAVPATVDELVLFAPLPPPP